MSGLALFAAASLLGGLAWSPAILIVGRFAQGAGAALVAPGALALLTSTFEHDRHRAHALGVFQAATAGGATAGLVLGGILVQLLGWRSVMLVNPPIIVVLVALIAVKIPRSTGNGPRPRLNVLGSVLITGTLACLVAGMSLGESQGFAAFGTLALLAVALLLAIAFAVLQVGSAHPMLPHALFARRIRIGALIVVVLEFAVVVSYVYFISLYLQHGLGFSALLTGVALIPATATVMLTSIFVSKRLLPILGIRWQLVVGLLMMAGGQSVLAFVSPTTSYGAVVVPGLLLTAFGMGVSIPAAALAANAEVTPELRGTAGGLFVTAQQVGASVGLAVLATVAAATTRDTHQLTAGFDRAYLVSVGLALVAALVAALIVPARAARTTSPIEQEQS